MMLNLRCGFLRATRGLIGACALVAAVSASAQVPPVPEILYYKFNESGATVTNHASAAPAGTATATVVGALTQNNTFSDTAQSLNGTGTSSSSDYVNTNWATSLSGSWTLSFATSNIAQSTSTYYILGDVNAGGFRCFSGGVAGVGNWILRGPLTDVFANGAAATAPHMTTFVYDQAAGNIYAYVDAVLVSTVSQPAIFGSSAGPFKVGAYSSSANLNGNMADFRLYSRALTQGEVTDIFNYVLKSHYVGGTASGIARTGLVLQNNAGDDLPVDADGTFTFATPLVDASAYDVTVSAQPPGQLCSVSNGSGNLAGASVTDVSVSCVDTATQLVLAVVDDGSNYVRYGQPVDYLVTLTNNGGTPATDVTVSSSASGLDAALAQWSCTPAGGATCTATGNGPFGDTVTVPFNGSLSWLVSMSALLTGDTAEFDVAAPGTTASDVNTLVIFRDGFGN